MLCAEQTFYTNLLGRGGIHEKTAAPAEEIDSLIAWCEPVEQAILKHGLKEPGASN